MKKKTFRWITLFLIIQLILAFFSPVYAEESTANNTENNSVQIFVNDVQVELTAAPITKNGTTLIPLRSLLESVKMNVQWNNKEQKITISKKDLLVELKIDSTSAQVNGEEVKLSQAPVLEGSIVYVPLRFVSEVVGGSVSWDSVNKVIAIYIPVEEKPLQTSIVKNGKTIYTNEEIIVKDEWVYIPVNKLAEIIGIKANVSQDLKSVSIVKDKDSLQLQVDSNLAVINQVTVETEFKPFIHNNKLFVPAQFVGDLFGFTVTWNDETKQLFFYSRASMFDLEIIRKYPSPTNIPKQVPEDSVKPVEGRRLIVSDNPETLDNLAFPYTEAVLWSDRVYTDEDKVDYRTYVYHVNQTGNTIKLGINITNYSDSNEIEIKDLRGSGKESSDGWSIIDVGVKIAELSISDKLPDIDLANTVVGKGESITLDYFFANHEHLMSFLHEFTVEKKSGTGPLDFEVRIVASKNKESDLSRIHGPLLKATGVHPRGTWEYSEIYAELPVYKVGDKDYSYSISNGFTDHLFTAEKSLGDKNESRDNKGHFGATYRVKIPIENKDGKPRKLLIRVNPRGGYYAGAISTPEGEYIIPPMNPFYEVCNVMEYTVEEGKDEVELVIMHAGGGHLPVSIDILTIYTLEDVIKR